MSATISTKKYYDGDYKRSTSLEKRKEESQRILEKHPHMLPIIFEKQKNSTVSDLDKFKIMISHKHTVAEFMHVMRKRINIKPEESIYIFINNALPNMSITMAQLYKENKDEDGFLYIVYASEATFG
jgi:GABA(A) receptor-associated protein